MSKLREVYSAEIDRILAQYPAGRQKSAVLPLMHLAQEVYGHMSQEAKEDVAGILNVDPTHVLSIAGFYTLYHEAPNGKVVIEVCNDLACALRGGDQFLEMTCDKLGVANHGTTEDGMFTVHNVMCIGACDRAPVLQANLKFHEHMNETKLDKMLATYRSQAKKGKAPTSVVDRVIAHHK
ncbi:MAG: NADH-quinone oxidoreductase subunit NuoE [Candidatus Promineifilaceae bacterium]